MLEKRCVFFEILFSTILWGWVQNDSQGFPNRVDCWGTIGQNGQKLHENGKISIFGSKQWEGCGGDKPIFRLEWGAYPQSSYTRRNPDSWGFWCSYFNYQCVASNGPESKFLWYTNFLGKLHIRQNYYSQVFL